MKNLTNVYKFNRDVRNFPHMLAKNPTGFKFHPKLCLISSDCYWNIGGFDEDFCGHYGLTDTAFYTRGMGKYKMNFLDEVLLIIDDKGDAPGIDRSKQDRNRKLLDEKVKFNSWSTNILRFEWNKIDINFKTS